MPRLDEQLKRIRELRRQRADFEERLYAVQLELDKVETLLRQTKRNEIASNRAGGELEEKRKHLRAEYERLKKDLSGRSADLQSAIAGIYADPHPRSSIGELNDNVPFLLMPVRIETRFSDVGRGSQLWVRIYPDDIAIHTHEKLLTDDEVAAGVKYWKALFEAEKNGGDLKEEQKKAAWRELVSSFGPTFRLDRARDKTRQLG